MSESNYPDNVLFQRIEMFYKPAANWNECQLPMTTIDFFTKLNEQLPGYFEGPEHLQHILKELQFIISYNEDNQKYYWLVNPAHT